ERDGVVLHPEVGDLQGGLSPSWFTRVVLDRAPPGDSEHQQRKENPAMSVDSAAITDGTELAPNFSEGPADSGGDVEMHQRYYTFRTDAGLVAGKTASVMFTIDRPA